jgi:hypothetical protein
MEPNDQPAYPLLEALLHIKGLTLQATYTNADVALMFDISTRSIQNRAADGTLHSRKLFGRTLFLPIDLERFLSGGKNSGDV